MAGFFREHVLKAFVERSSQWPTTRKAFINSPGNDCCKVCKKRGSLANLQVHHVVPFSVDPSKELDPGNLITLCGKHHLTFGHLEDFHSWNVNIREDAEAFGKKVENRPSKENADET